MRELTDPERFRARAEEAAILGFPDYYDDQRFGSLRGTEGEFIAPALIAGDFERALRLAIASPDAKDRSAVRRRRAALRDGWGEWAHLAGALPESFERKVVERLESGASFEEAYALIDPELRRLHLSAYQAHLFNERVRAIVTKGPEWPGVEGPYRFHEEPVEDRAIALEVFAPLPFRAGERRLVCRPGELRAERREAAVHLRFRLRPGSYATMLIKRCASGTTAP